VTDFNHPVQNSWIFIDGFIPIVVLEIKLRGQISNTSTKSRFFFFSTKIMSKRSTHSGGLKSPVKDNCIEVRIILVH